MKLLYKFDGNLPFFCFFFVCHAAWKVLLVVPLMKEASDGKLDSSDIYARYLYSSKLQNCVIPHKVQFCVHVYVDEVDHKFLWSNHLAKKVVSGSAGLLGFAIRPVKSVLNLPSKCPASELLLLLLLLLLCCFFWGGGGEIQMTEELYSMMLIKKYKIFTCLPQLPWVASCKTDFLCTPGLMLMKCCEQLLKHPQSFSFE